MKKIKFPKGYIISAFNGPTENIVLADLPKLMEPIEYNKAKIIDAAYNIESRMESIINFHFFQRLEGNKERSKEFTDHVLKSDWCTYAAKKKLINHIVESLKILEGKERSELDNLLSKTMKYRNAFTHGEISTDGRDIRLSYFQGTPQFKTLNEDYFTQVEKDLNKCFEEVENVGFKTGAFKKHEMN